MSDLSELSKSYYSQADIYKIFSDAEDKPNFILKSLQNSLRGLVLDVGCGNGKYCELLSSHCDMIGVDKADGQLSQAPAGLNLVQADCLALPFNKVFDYALACWMLGTLIYPEKQVLALKEIESTLKKSGEIILIENDTGSEFEAIRGRDRDNRTSEYNQFLIRRGFRVIEKIDTYFEFSSAEIANYCFEHIWGDRLQFKFKSPIIEHRVLVLAKKV